MPINRYKEYEFAKGWASVTSITGMLEKPYLYKWYGDLGWEEAHRVNDHSKKIGALIDNEICHYFGDKEIPDLDKSVLNHPESKAYYLQAINNFHKVVDHLKPKSVLGQQVVYSKENKYIGTFDRLLLIHNKLVLSDWKATNSVSYEYEMQLEAYYRALTEMIKIGILNIDGKLSNEWHEYPLWIIQFPKKEEVDLTKNLIKFTPDERTWNNFKHLLAFHYGKKEITNERKENKPKREKKKNVNK